jgi:hypothetical protein
MGEVLKGKYKCPFVAPELYFVHGKPGSTNAYKVENKKHLYSMAADAYAVG